MSQWTHHSRTIDQALDQLKIPLSFTKRDRQIGIERLSIIKRKLRGTR